MTHQYKLESGGKTTGAIVLKNSSDGPSDVKIFQTDYAFMADGKTIYDDPGNMTRSNAKWITFTPQQITIPAGETETVYFTVQAPQDKNLTGTYWSVLMVEPMPPSSLEPPKSEPDKVNIGIRSVMRYAIQIVTSIGDTGKSSVKFANKKLIVKTNHRSMQVDIENIGDKWLTPQIWADIFDESGKPFGRLTGNKLRIYPGCSARFEIDMSSLSKGKYNALLVADNSDDNIFGTQCQFEIN